MLIMPWIESARSFSSSTGFCFDCETSSMRDQSARWRKVNIIKRKEERRGRTRTGTLSGGVDAAGKGGVGRLDRLERDVGLRAVVRRVVGEDGGAVEGRVVFGEVEPALVTDARGKDATDSDTDNVRRREDELARDGAEVLCLVDDLGDEVERGGRDHRAVRDGGAVRKVGNLLVSLDTLDRLVEGEALLRESLGDGLPDTSSTVTGREAESGVGTPVGQ